MRRITLSKVILATSSLLASVYHLNASVLSYNLNQPAGYTESIDPSTLIASSFGTGSYSSNLQDVQMLVQLDGQVSPDVWLYTDQTGQPGKAVGSLRPVQLPASFGVALFSGQNLALSPDSTYWIVAGSASGTWEWAYAQTDQGSGSGFQHTWGVSLDNGQNWFVSNSQPMMMSVADTAVPEPRGFALLGFGVLALNLIRKTPIRNTEA